MGEGVVDRDLGQLGSRPAPERPARRRQHDPSDALVVVVGAQAHVDGAVLGVDRNQLGSGRLPSLLHDRRRGDQRLLVGERQPLARLQGAQGHRQAGEADDAVDTHIGQAADLGQRVGAGVDLGSRGDRILELARQRIVGDGDDLGADRLRLRG